MKHQPTPAQAAYLTNRDRPGSPLGPTTEGLKLSMILNGWTNPQTININTDIYVAASTTGCSIFVKGAPGAYEIQLCGADPRVGADLQTAHIPSPAIVCEIWRLLNRKD